MDLSIEVENLTKRYDSILALDSISFQVQKGEIMGFLGPNGAGKTTTLRILTGLIKPSSGQVRINGMDVENDSLKIRHQIGYLPENVSLYPELRVSEYLAYRAQIKAIPRQEVSKRLAEVLNRCALEDVSRKLLGRLSKGYRQRVALADCLINRPSVLILDEPTVGLDPHQIRQTRELIKSLGRETTILLSTHILPEVEMICDRVTIIDKGKIVAIDSPENLRKQLSGSQSLHLEIKGKEELINQALDYLKNLQGIEVNTRMPLEEIFIKLTTKEQDT
jgi:ABC-2 type transport system ATP-binding protein